MASVGGAAGAVIGGATDLFSRSKSQPSLEEEDDGFEEEEEIEMIFSGEQGAYAKIRISVNNW